MNPNEKKNIRFVVIFSIILVAALYLTASFSKKPNHNVVNQQNMWVEGDYGQAKNSDLDIKKLQEALVSAKDPADFEEKVNAIYQGSEIVSINIENKSTNSQFVHLYIDKEPLNGLMDKEEKIISLERKVDANNQGQVIATGYGPYSHYSSVSPFFYGIAGSIIGNWLISSHSYSTPISRYQDIQSFKSPVTKSKPSWGANTSNKGSWKGTTAPKSSSSSSWTSRSSSKGWGSKFKMRSFGRRR